MSNQSNQCVTAVNNIDDPSRNDGMFKRGNTANIRHSNPQTRYVRKLQLAMDKAVDKLGKKMQTDGADACAELIAIALQEDIVGTLHKLSFFMPKNINVDVQVTKDSRELTDAELEQLIADRRAIAHSREAALIKQLPSDCNNDTQVIDSVEIVSSDDEYK